jgi:hypothetical protein
VNGQTYNGTICVWLFARTNVTVQNGLGAPVTVRADVPIVNTGLESGTATYWTRSESPWPSTWTELHIKMRFASLSLSPTDRLGLAITVDRGGTGSSEGLEFLYDHPNFDSRLEVITQGLLPF